MNREKEIANWILQKILNNGYFYQEVIAKQLKEEFGDEYVYRNQNGNVAINRKILDEFRKISNEKVVWERGSRRWRLRGLNDNPNRQQS